MAKQVNVYRSNGEWAYALWIDGECDHSDMLDAETEAEAMAAARKLAGTGGTVERVADVTL